MQGHHLLGQPGSGAPVVSFSGSAHYLRVFALFSFAVACTLLGNGLSTLSFAPLYTSEKTTPAILLVVGGLIAAPVLLVLRLSAFEFNGPRTRLMSIGAFLSVPLLVGGAAASAVHWMKQLSDRDGAYVYDGPAIIYFVSFILRDMLLATSALALPILAGIYGFKHVEEVEGRRPPAAMIEECALTQGKRFVCGVLSFNFATGMFLTTTGVTALVANLSDTANFKAFALFTYSGFAIGGIVMLATNSYGSRLLVKVDQRGLPRLRILLAVSAVALCLALVVILANYLTQLHDLSDGSFERKFALGYRIQTAFTCMTIIVGAVLHVLAIKKVQ